jgi:type IV pilus assembly protein PilA
MKPATDPVAGFILSWVQIPATVDRYIDGVLTKGAGMRARAGPRRRSDQGFTLIELLVAIIIIGILAAVAIPVFLHQRTKAYDAAAKSDLRGLAQSEEILLNDTNAYGTMAAMLADGVDLRASKDVTLTVVFYNGVSSYCLSAKNGGSATTWWYDSAAGGLQPRGTAACPVTAAGTGGDTITG